MEYNACTWGTAVASCLVLLQGGRVFNSRPMTYRSTWWKAGDDLNANLCGTLVYDHPLTRDMAPEGWCDAGWLVEISLPAF